MDNKLIITKNTWVLYSLQKKIKKIILKELVMPYIGQNWHAVKIDGMCTQCTRAVQLICTKFVSSLWCSYKRMYFWYIWQPYSTYRYNIKRANNLMYYYKNKQLLCSESWVSSGSGSGFGTGSRFVFPDPDPHQNEAGLKHCLQGCDILTKLTIPI